MDVELSVPVLWTEDGGPPLAGRLDVTVAGLRFDGGSRAERRTRDVAFDEIDSFRVARDERERIHGRRAIVLELRDGGRLAFVGFESSGALHELTSRLERGGR